MSVTERIVWWLLLVTSSTLCLLPVSALHAKTGSAVNIKQNMLTSCPLIETMDLDACDISGDYVFVDSADNNTTTVPQGTMCMLDAHGDDLIVMECVDSTWIEMDERQGSSTDVLKREKRFWGFIAVFIIGIVLCVFLCRKENRSPTVHCPSINSVMYYDKGQPHKKVTWGPAHACDPEDGSLLAWVSSGIRPGSYLNVGFYSVTYMTRDSKGKSDECTKKFEIRAIYCSSSYKSLYDGYASCSASNLYGSRCTYSCKTGYELRGYSTTECLISGSWSNSHPSCKAVTCGTPQPVLNGRVSCYSYTYGSSCSVSCTTIGYTLRGSGSFICQANRMWTSAGYCSDIMPPDLHCTRNITAYPGPLLNKTSVFWPMANASDNSGQPVTITSDLVSGSNFSVGTHKITFTASDQAGLKSYCTMNVIVQIIKCNASESAPEFSNVTCSHGNVYGSECTVECHQGYTLHGDMRRECQENGTWSGTPAKCIPVPCSDLPTVEKGVFDCPSGESYQDQCSLMCTEGYQVMAPVSVTCGIDGKWTVAGSCIDVEAPVFPNGCPEQKFNASRFGKKTSVTYLIPNVTDSSRENVTVQAKPEPGSVFPVGNSSVVVTAVDASVNIATCSFLIVVESLICELPNLNSTDKLLKYNCPNKHVYGATCGLACLDRNPVQGPSHVTCDMTDGKLEWKWLGNIQPYCQSGVCPKLREPKNGALACSNFLGNEGKQCIIICDENYVYPKTSAPDMYICFQINAQWTNGGYVPDCLEKHPPRSTRSTPSLVFNTKTCDENSEAIKKTFLEKLKKSALRGVCDVKDRCTVANVNITCQTSGRKRRSAEDKQYQYEVVFELALAAIHDSAGGLYAMEFYTSLIGDINTALLSDVEHDTYSFPELGTFDSFSHGNLDIDCEPGTLFDYGTVTCSGCGTGYMFDNITNSCLPCPMGTYQNKEVAFSCTPCPSGMTTRDSRSVAQEQCLIMCQPGESSLTGALPCFPCERGSYQPSPGSTSCQPCPFGMTTQFEGANSTLDCLFYNIRMDLPTEQPFVQTTQPSLKAFTLLMWLNLPWSNNKANWAFSLEANPTTSKSASVTIGNVQVFVAPEASEEKKVSLRWYHIAVVQNSTTRVLYVQGEVIDKLPAMQLNLAGSNTTFSFLKSNSLENIILSGVQLMSSAITVEVLRNFSHSCNKRVTSNLLMVIQVDTSLTTPSTCDAINNCEGSPCGDHGTCVDELDHFTCVCDDTWSGDKCQIAPPDYCLDNRCAEGSTCLNDARNRTYRCQCPDGFKGRFCQDQRVNGNWGSWQEWGDCSITCGSGKRSRVRECDDPSPDPGGEDCAGSGTEYEECLKDPCPVNGLWSEWSSWTCSRTCGQGTESRHRKCNNPAPSPGGRQCMGPTNTFRICENKGCPVHGQYGEWSSWSQCSASCAGGVSSRSRACDSPAPASGGAPCVTRDAVESKTCNIHQCPVCKELRFEGDPDFLKCVKDETNDMTVCNITCKLGMTLEPADLNEFKCGRLTNYTWSQQTEDNPTGILPKCTNVKIPASQKTMINVQYDNIDCNSPPPLSDFQNSISHNMEQSISCKSTKDCSGDVKATLSCDRRKRSTGSVVVVLSVDFPQANSTVEYLSDLSEAEIEAEMNRLYAIENITLQLLNQTNEISKATVDGVEYRGEIKSAFAELTCQDGSGFKEGVCVDCPVGSYSVGNGSCFLCAQGFYQDQPRSSACLPCPEGLITSGLGSSNLSDCMANPPTYNDFFSWIHVDEVENVDEVEDLDAVLHPNTTQTTSDNSDDNITVLIASIMGVAASLAVITSVIYFVYRCRTKTNTGDIRSEQQQPSREYGNQIYLPPEAETLLEHKKTTHENC